MKITNKNYKRKNITGRRKRRRRRAEEKERKRGGERGSEERVKNFSTEQNCLFPNISNFQTILQQNCFKDRERERK